MPHLQRRLLTGLEFQLKLRRLRTPNVGENVEHPEFWCVAGGRVDGKATLENSLIVSYKNVLIYEPAILLLRIYLWAVKAYVY